jgi:hypothetical protein
MKLSKAPSPSSAVRKGARNIRRLLPQGLRPSNFGDRDGVALVITLIMLSIITFMAVTFLVLSQRERSSVSTAMDQKTARNASDAGLARVSAELLTRMLLKTNFQDFGLLVSTNYINAAGLNPVLNLNPTNVNYDYLVDHNLIINSQDRNLNVASLLFNPRPPVFVVTNAGTGETEFRYYLDLNRNGRFDRNGDWPLVVLDNTGKPSYLSTNAAGQFITVATNSAGWVMTNYFVGDPEWIGVLERPEELHSADNRFIARYAYIVVPVGKTLDVNTMHNAAMTRTVNRATGPIIADGYARNQGTGPWELNLAAFLVDLNTNEWFADPTVPQNYYRYDEGDVNSLFFPAANKGIAFDDARALLSHRYGYDYATLAPAANLFPGAGASLTDDNIDEYADGPRMLGTITNEAAALDKDNPAFGWPGAENTNHFFSTQDLFDRTKTQTGFTPGTLGFSDRLQRAGGSNDSYNAYTYYRMLQQLGTDSAPDQDKINLNFKNTDIHGNIIPGMETNMIPWTALDFFTNAAAAMFRQMNMRDFNGNLVTVTNIPIYVDPVITGRTNLNYYTPAVHRVLQLAANMFDITTNRIIGGGPTNYPTVFRPFFRSEGGVVYIDGFKEVEDGTEAFLPFLELRDFATTDQPINKIVNMYGIPWVIGAKKGMPNFNEMSMENALEVSRKLEFTNVLGKASPPWKTNQVFDLSITNTFGVEAWNSYTNAYGRALRMVVSNEVNITITNENGVSLLSFTNLPFGRDLSFTGWPGWSERLSDTSFKVPLQVNFNVTNGTYAKNVFLPLNPPRWDVTIVPHLWMLLQLKLRYILLDTSVTPNRVIDFVNIVDTRPLVDIGGTLHNNATGVRIDTSTDDGQWNTNLNHGFEMGILNQILAGKNSSSPVWKDTPANKITQAGNFNEYLNDGGTNHFQAPFTPHRTIYQRVSLEANDPLVHYTAPDITSTNGSAQANYNGVYLTAQTQPLATISNLNYSFQPWGGRHIRGGNDLNPNEFSVDWRVKDPKMEQSDNWNFPTNKLPNIGWLGRVHRGTAWQTVYMKSAALTTDDWIKYGNDNVFLTNGNNVLVDATFGHPTDDYRLFDLFSASISENASAGRLNVNQTNLAAWSAVLTGVNVLSNSSGTLVPMVIPPAGVYDPTNPTPVAAIVQAINNTRANTNQAKGALLTFRNQTFQHAGDVLATPQLSIASPFLNTNKLATVDADGISDEVMERIPQQVMSLLTLNQSPRFVIYSYGQTLHPAEHSLVTGGTFNGLCTNYQITAESATRAVVRVEGTSDPQYINGKVDPQGRSYPPHLVVEQFNVLGPD